MTYWVLEVRDVTIEDEGTYECKIGKDRSKQPLKATLTVVPQNTIIIKASPENIVLGSDQLRSVTRCSAKNAKKIIWEKKDDPHFDHKNLIADDIIFTNNSTSFITYSDFNLDRIPQNEYVKYVGTWQCRILPKDKIG